MCNWFGEYGDNIDDNTHFLLTYTVKCVMKLHPNERVKDESDVKRLFADSVINERYRGVVPEFSTKYGRSVACVRCTEHDHMRKPGREDTLKQALKDAALSPEHALVSVIARDITALRAICGGATLTYQWVLCDTAEFLGLPEAAAFRELIRRKTYSASALRAAKGAQQQEGDGVSGSPEVRPLTRGEGAALRDLMAKFHAEINERICKRDKDVAAWRATKRKPGNDSDEDEEGDDGDGDDDDEGGGGGGGEGYGGGYEGAAAADAMADCGSDSGVASSAQQASKSNAPVARKPAKQPVAEYMPVVSRAMLAIALGRSGKPEADVDSRVLAGDLALLAGRSRSDPFWDFNKDLVAEVEAMGAKYLSRRKPNALKRRSIMDDAFGDADDDEYAGEDGDGSDGEGEGGDSEDDEDRESDSGDSSDGGSEEDDSDEDDDSDSDAGGRKRRKQRSHGGRKKRRVVEEDIDELVEYSKSILRSGRRTRRGANADDSDDQDGGDSEDDGGADGLSVGVRGTKIKALQMIQQAMPLLRAASAMRNDDDEDDDDDIEINDAEDEDIADELDSKTATAMFRSMVGNDPYKRNLAERIQRETGHHLSDGEDEDDGSSGGS